LGAVQTRLAEEGITEATMFDVQAAFADIREEAKQTVADFRMGGAVDLGQLQQSMGLLPLFEQAQKLGGVSAIFGQAATPAAEQFAKAVGPEGVSAFDSLTQGADQSLGDLVTTFETAFARIDKIVEDSAAKWTTTVSGVVPDMARAIEQELVRSIDLARAKR
jgi:hypothetical protein